MKKLKITEVHGIDALDFNARFDELSKQLRKLIERLNQPSYPRLLSRKETAKILGISLVSLSNYVKLGIIPAYRLGNGVLFKENEVYEALTKKSNNNKKN